MMEYFMRKSVSWNGVGRIMVALVTLTRTIKSKKNKFQGWGECMYRIVIKEDDTILKSIMVNSMPQRLPNPLIMINGEGYKIRSQIENFLTYVNTADIELIIEVEKNDSGLRLQKLKDENARKRKALRKE